MASKRPNETVPNIRQFSFQRKRPIGIGLAIIILVVVALALGIGRSFYRERMLGLQYPNTTVIVFPGAMIAKRNDRRERIDFASFFDSVVAQVEQLKDDPEYEWQAAIK